jgi:hypothetical protein
VRSLALVLLAAAVLAGCGGTSVEREEPPLQPPPKASVTELDNVLQLRSDFEADAGKTRVIVLLSPT